MASDKGLVPEIHCRRLHHALNHLLRLVEEPLIVRAHRGAVANTERLITGPTGAAGTLYIVCRGRRDIPHIDVVQSRNINTQFHRG